MSRLLFLGLIISFFLLSCSKENDNIDAPELSSPQLVSLSFSSLRNPSVLVEDVQGRIIGDSIVECWIPHLVTDKKLKVDIVCQGGAEIGNALYDKDSLYEFSRPLELSIRTPKAEKRFKVYVHSFTGLPVLWIETENREDIVSKDDYLNAQFRLVEDVVTRGAGDIINFDAKIKGRGNSTWLLPKKPYRIKCEKKISILDMPEGKSWVLLANYADKSMLRNHLAMFLGAMSNLDYTPRMKMVEVMLNGRYQGTYQLSEKVQIAKNRVETDGYLLEMDSYADKEQDAIWFRTKRLPQPINIKDSKTDLTSEDIDYIKTYIQKAEDVLYGEEFKDYNKGWRKYFDEESFADWYVLNEIAKNWDAVRWSSTYMSLPKNGKLKMGPLWDYDIAFGNTSRDDGCDAAPEGWQIRNQAWFDRLFEDDAFVKLVKERHSFYYGKMAVVLQELNEQSHYLKLSAYENDCKWDILYNYTWRNRDIWGNYLNEVQLLKNWLNDRMEWLKGALYSVELS